MDISLRSFTLLAVLSLLATAHASVFTDRDLESLLTEKKEGLILVWSSDMPLSTLALEEAPAVAAALELGLTAIRDEDMKSSELAYHGVLNHFPAIMLFRKGRLLPFLIQGYEEPRSLIDILKEQK